MARAAQAPAHERPGNSGQTPRARNGRSAGMSSHPGRAHLELRLLLGCLLVLPALQCGGSDDGGEPPATAAASPGTAGSTPGAGTSVVPAAASDTWSSYAQGFFTSYCVSCHNDDNAGDAAR